MIRIYSSTNPYVLGIMKYFNVTNTAASIVYRWYAAEDALDDFDDVLSFCKYVKKDLQDMLDAASDPEDADIIAEEFNLISPFDTSL